MGMAVEGSSEMVSSMVLSRLPVFSTDARLEQKKRVARFREAAAKSRR
jgi:hypothetical protein